jgi:hypothetical protein
MSAAERFFDLNIVEILDAWSPRHGVRELIANALDEQALTTTQEPVVENNNGAWVVKDYGRGIRYSHLTQNESPEKLANPGKVIGKFGVGLKDAIAALHRHRVSIEIRSPHGQITFTERAKHGFDEVPTLHAVIRPPSTRRMVGTEIVLRGISDAEMIAAKELFLRFSGEEIVGDTRYGQIIRRRSRAPARIYVNGVVVAEDDGFAFSYNITSLNAGMRKALNRERTNVGRTAFADRVKVMLLACTSPVVAEILAEEIGKLDVGTAHDEVKWSDVAVHACKILNATKSVVFVSSRDLSDATDAVDHARSEGHKVILLPQNIRERLSGEKDSTGSPVRALDVFLKEWSDSFKFEFVDESKLTSRERAVFSQRAAIARLVGGLPRTVKQVLVTTTMRPNSTGRTDELGLWDVENRRIIVHRNQLTSVESFAGTLIHEIVHAQSGYADVTRDFEEALTGGIGVLAAKALRADPPLGGSVQERGQSTSGSRRRPTSY